jgi:hypothetical protein
VSLRILDMPFTVIPKEMEEEFIKNVISNYTDCIRYKNIDVASDVNVCDEMLDQISQIASLTIFEDKHHYQQYADEDPMLDVYSNVLANQFNGFMYDIVLAFERNKMCYQLEYDSTYRNLPGVKVW